MSTIDIFAVSNAKHQNHEDLVSDVADNSIFTETIPPQSFELARQSFACSSRISRGREVLAKEAKDSPLGRMAEFLEFLQRTRFKLNLPSQAF
jgi:hypothetical protein